MMASGSRLIIPRLREVEATHFLGKSRWMNRSNSPISLAMFFKPKSLKIGGAFHLRYNGGIITV